MPELRRLACGASLAAPRLRRLACGASLAAPGKGGGCLIIAAQVFLGGLVLVFGLGGACFVLLGGISLPSLNATSGATFTELLPFIGGGLLGLALAAACVWGIVKLGKRRQ